MRAAPQAEKEAAEAAANAAQLIEKKRMQLAQVQAQAGKSKASAGSKAKSTAAAGSSTGGTKRKQSAAALNDDSAVSNDLNSEKGMVRAHACPSWLHLPFACDTEWRICGGL